MVHDTKLYDLLQISTEADEHEIRKAYKKLALKYHPDKQKFNNEEEQESITNIFESISNAYSILKDTNKRRLYDNYGEAVATNPELQTQIFSTNNHQYDHQQFRQTYQNSSFHQNGNLYPNFATQSSQFQDASNLFNQFFDDVNSGGMFNNINPLNGSTNFENPNFGPQFGNGFTHFTNNNNNILNQQQQQQQQQQKYQQHQQQLHNLNQQQNHMKHNHSKSKSNKSRKGRDIHDNIYCSLLDYYKGEEFKLSLSRRIKCPKCEARGGMKIYTCNDCCGNGVIINEVRSGVMYQRNESTCARCNGTGKFIPAKFVCDECGGNKLVDTKIILNFKTPRGVSDGYKIIFPNAADEGLDIIPGDVIITLRDDNQNNNTKFKRFGNNLLTTISIPLATVLCGGHISFDHIDGDKIKIFIPRGDIKSGNQLKILKGYGMPVHKQSSSSTSSSKSKSKSKKNKKKSKSSKKLSTESNENSEFHTVEHMGVQEMTGTSSISSEGNSSSDDKIKCEYGDLYVRFEIELPDAKNLSNQQVDLLGKVFGLTQGDIGPELSKISSSDPSSNTSSDDDVGSLKMSSNYETSTSSLSKAYKSSESNSNGSDDSVDSNKFKKPAQIDDYVQQSYLQGKNPVVSTKVDGVELIEHENSSSMNDSSDSTDAMVDSNGNKIVYLQDLTDINKIGLSLLDFPEAYNEKTTDTKNGDISASVADKNKTAEVMDNSFSDLKPRQKKAKTRRFV